MHSFGYWWLKDKPMIRNTPVTDNGEWLSEISCTFLFCAGKVQKIDENRSKMCKKWVKMRRKCKKMHKKSLFYCVHEIFFVILQPEKCGADERYMSIIITNYI